jgi:hypothetical protein
MENDAKMQIIKQAMAEGYKGNFTDLIMQREQEMQQQGQGQEEPQQVQEQAPQQPMPGGMEMPQQVDGDLVQSYQDAPPGITNNPTGEDVSGVVTDANEYKDGGEYKVSDMIEYEEGGPKVSDKSEKIRRDAKTMGWKRQGGVKNYYPHGGEHKTEGQRRRDLNSAISNVATNDKEKKLLEVTNFQENSMGYNPAAYGRKYTNSQASIDPIMLTDLFSPRVDEDGKSQGYSKTQKKYFKRFEEMGLPSDSTGFKKELQKDNPVAATEAMRMVYGRTPDAIPEVTDTLGMFNYYNDNYRKNNKVKDLTESKKRFYEGYKMKFKRGGK